MKKDSTEAFFEGLQDDGQSSYDRTMNRHKQLQDKLTLSLETADNSMKPIEEQVSIIVDDLLSEQAKIFIQKKIINNVIREENVITKIARKELLNEGFSLKEINSFLLQEMEFPTSARDIMRDDNVKGAQEAATYAQFNVNRMRDQYRKIAAQGDRYETRDAHELLTRAESTRDEIVKLLNSNDKENIKYRLKKGEQGSRWDSEARRVLKHRDDYDAKERGKNTERFQQNLVTGTKTAGIVVGSVAVVGAAVIASYHIYKRFLSAAAKNCNKLSGHAKTQCMIKFKIKGCVEAIKKLESSKLECKQKKNPEKCIRSMDNQIIKWKMKIKKYQSDLV